MGTVRCHHHIRAQSSGGRMLFLQQTPSDREESAKSTRKTGKAREFELLHSAPARLPGSLALGESPLGDGCMGGEQGFFIE